MNNFLEYSTELTSYNEFNSIVVDNLSILNQFKDKLNKLTKYEFSISKTFELGFILKSFYELYNDKKYNDAFLYSFGFNGYLSNLHGLLENIKLGKINFTKFINKKRSKQIHIKNNYYAPLMNETPVKNDIQISKNMIITGPNASGKTTVLKSTLINIILSQQFGCGFYDSATIYPYKYIHCYLNIPDTSGRDSLFQAESRRCKEILDIIQEFKDDTHICIFDELFSGTNHTEAVISATAFMNYLVKFKTVSCLLTTHFIKVCKKLNKNKNITNFNMHTLKTNTNKNIHTYLLKEGISEVKGGFQVLHDLNFPTEILKNI
jgi:DNA mismatch repair ATPase MutS